MTKLALIIALFALGAVAYFAVARGSATEVRAREAALQRAATVETATFAGGCFWCMEPPFEKIDGVLEVISGYTGGHKDNPTYKEVSAGGTGHLESVEVRFDPTKVSYAELLEVFWRNIDPTDGGGQFVDRGGQYASAIFYHDARQKGLAEASLSALEGSGKFKDRIATGILPAGRFYVAEDYHQDYYRRNPVRYKYYRNGSGRDRFLDATWGGEARGEGVIEKLRAADSPYKRPPEAEISRTLTPLQYEVIMKNGTEPQYSSELYNEKREGIYVDLLSGEPLFSSRDKYDSGTGWPSFTRPLEPANIVETEDRSHFMVRTEVRSRHGDAHLGHVFNDGPRPTGLRYCMNGVALRFVPRQNMEAEGYAKYLDDLGK